MADGQSFRYPRTSRVRKGAEIRALLRAGSRSRCGPIEVFRASSAQGRPRAGIIVPRYGHSVVQRNLLKRRLRECVRTLWLPGAGQQTLPDDIVVRARPGAYELDFSDLRDAFLRCAAVTV